MKNGWTVSPVFNESNRLVAPYVLGRRQRMDIFKSSQLHQIFGKICPLIKSLFYSVVTSNAENNFEQYTPIPRSVKDLHYIK
jgi:hypothetical protein